MYYIIFYFVKYPDTANSLKPDTLVFKLLLYICWNVL
jgi:hypothetical protein